jgi:hypothetical protein
MRQMSPRREGKWFGGFDSDDYEPRPKRSQKRAQKKPKKDKGPYRKDAEEYKRRRPTMGPKDDDYIDDDLELEDEELDLDDEEFDEDEDADTDDDYFEDDED